MRNLNNPFLQRIKEFWQPYADDEVLTDEHAQEIYDNSVAFVNVLLEWDREDREKEANNND